MQLRNHGDVRLRNTQTNTHRQAGRQAGRLDSTFFKSKLLGHPPSPPGLQLTKVLIVTLSACVYYSVST